MTTRYSIYAGPPITALLLAADPEGTGSVSTRINAIAERYEAIVADALRRLPLSRAEWCAILDVMNGTSLLSHMYLSLWQSIADSPEMDEKWDIDTRDLARRVAAMPIAERVAIIEAVDRFWARAGMDTDAALAAAGIAVAKEPDE